MMSQRSVLEINHDCSSFIASDESHFVQLLLAALASGSDRSWDRLKRYGILRVTQCHHSEARKIVVSGGAIKREYRFG